MKFDIKKLQAIELEAVEEIARICELEKIEWFLVGGSVLGAVRHNGFIPWDDDIDLGMYRSDYERFIKVANKHLTDKYFLQTLKTDKGYHLGYAKLRVNNTLYIQENVKNRKMHQGVFIDIYPIDEVPDSEKARKKQKLYSNLSYALCRGEVVSKQGKAIKIATSVLTKVCPKSLLHAVGVFFDDKVKTFTGKEIANVYGIKQYYAEIMPREFIGTPKLHKFESLMLPIPEKYEDYLTHLYGDYMELPSEDERQLKHLPIEYDF